MKNNLEKISAFENIIYKSNIANDGLTIPNSVIDAVLKEFKKLEVQSSLNNKLRPIDGSGICYCTYNIPALSFFDIPETEIFLNWIKEQIKLAATNLGFENVQPPKLTIDWMNLMTKGSVGTSHSHHDDSELDTFRKLVAIFYLQAPENSAKLVVIDNLKDYTNEFRGISPSDIPKEELFHIGVISGDLVIHKVAVPHAVSEHLSDTPRICVVMEFSI